MPLPYRSVLAALFLPACLLLSINCVVASVATKGPVKVDVTVVPNPTASKAAIQIADDGTVQVTKTTKAELSLKPKSSLPSGDLSLQFEAFCLGSVSQIKLKATRPNGETISLLLPKVAHSEAFVTYTADLYTDLNQVVDIKLHLNLKADTSLQIKSIRLVPRSSDSTSKKTEVPATAPASAQLSDYLDRSFPGQIESINATSGQLIVKGKVPVGSTQVLLVEIPMATQLHSSRPYRSTYPVNVESSGQFQTVISRIDLEGKDRAISRWQLVTASADSMEPFSHCRYANRLPCLRPNLPAATATSKKGLGGWHLSKSKKTENDLVDLGVDAITININSMDDLVSTEQSDGWPPFQWQGRTYYANSKRLKSIDRTLLAAQKQNVMVSAVLLVSNPKRKASDDSRLLANPEADSTGIFAMPNVTSEEGLQYYGAILKLMAERWTRPDGRYGRVHHWIMHNEVDFGWIWTNAGRKSDVQYMSLYHRSMRLADLIMRQYDPNAKVWISLTHHWASTGTSDGYGSKRMLELLLKFCTAEGDFPWAVAYHPYPQDLRNPRTWEDDQATFRFDTDKITPMNLEVLDAWMKRPEMKYQGVVRPVHLSENGFNSPDYSADSLKDQAAGMAIAWKKMRKLSSIKMWHYHNWIDNRREGGLRIGLRKFPDDKQTPYAAKPIWYLYQALATDNEDQHLQPYLKTIGISSWDEITHSEPIK